MNSKKILQRTLPLAIIILVIVAVAVACSVIPRNESKAKLSDTYANGNFLTIGDVSVTNQSAYEILTKSYGSSALVELIDAYLVQNVNAPSGETYYNKAKADTEGLDKWISDAIFTSGREIDKLDDDATDEEKAEAIDKDNETVANWFDVAISSYNVTSVKEVKEIYTLSYAKYLYTLDYLMDNSVYTLASDTVSVVGRYLSFGLSYGSEVLDLNDDKMAELEKALYAVRDEYVAKLYDLTFVTYEEAKIKSAYNSKKFKAIDVENASRDTAAARTSAKWNTDADIEKVFALKDQFLDALCAKLNEFGAHFASTQAMVDDDDAPTITNSYKSDYEADLEKEYWALYVKFNTVEERDNALAQINVAIVNYTWVNATTYNDAYTAGMAEEGANEDEVIEAAVEASKLDYDNVLSSMIKLYNNYNSTFTLKEGTKELQVAEAIDADGVTTLNNLINEWLAKDAFSAENGFSDQGSNFDIEVYNEGGESEDLALYEFLSNFHFTYSELAKVSSSFQTLISSTLKRGLATYKLALGTNYAVDLSTSYGPTSTANYTIVALKLGETAKGAYGKSWDDLTAAEQLEKAIQYVKDSSKDSYATSKTTTAFNELRKEKGLIILDQQYEDTYINSIDSTFEATNKKSKKLVAKIEDFELTADILFEKLTKDHGLINVMSLYEQDYFIHSEWSRLDEVYNSSKGKWLEKTDAYAEVISEPLQTAQDTFDYYNAYYLQYGYGTMTWEEFLNAAYGSYGVKTTDDLKMYFVYQDAEKRYSNRYQELGKYEDGAFTYYNFYNDDATYNLNGTKSLWDVLFTDNATKSYNQMAEIDKDYFSISGYHVLVCIKDENDKTVDPEEWTDAQVYYAEELYGKLVDILKAEEPDNRKTKVNSIIDSLKNVPILDYAKLTYTEGKIDVSTQTHNAKLTDESYEYSVYKTLGLSIMCEDLSTISSAEASNYDEAFIEGIKACYAGLIKNADGVDETQSNLHAIYGEDVPFGATAYTNEDGVKFLRGGFGYHIYTATAVNAYGKYGFTAFDDVEVSYSASYLTPEVIIYLSRTAKDGEYVRIDDNLLAKLDSNHELNKVFADWYSDNYAYDGVFKDVVANVRGLTQVKIGKLTDPASSDSESYYVTAASNCGSNDRLLYAQKTYLFDLLTAYIKANIEKFYTPVLKDVDGSNTNYALGYAMFIYDLSSKSFTFDPNFSLVKTIDLTDDKVYFVDEDGVKTELSYTARNGNTTLQFIFKYMLETITEDLTYGKDFTANLVGVEVDE